MPRRGISKLPKPKGKYRRRAAGFETVEEATREDRERARLLRKAAKDHAGAIKTKAAVRLAKRLDYERRRAAPPQTLASHLYVRDKRWRIGGALLRLIERSNPARVSTATLIPTDARFTLAQLASLDPRKLIEKLRADLNRYGAVKADGWAVFGLHGDFENEREVYQIHFHAVAADGMIDVIERLRAARKYRRPADQRASNYRPIWRSRKALTNLPGPLTYILKGFWSAKRRGLVASGEEKRNRKMSRIPEPFHTQVLLFLDRWSLEDIALLMKLGVGKRGFVRSKSKKWKGK